MERDSNAIQRTGRLAVFAARFLPSFTPSFLGLIAVRVWLQSTIYDRYLFTDGGFVTVSTNILRVVFIIAMLAIVVRGSFSPKAQRSLAIVSAISMSAASELYFFASQNGESALMGAASVLAAFGIVWGGGMWMTFFDRLRPAEALLYAFGALAGSCLAGFVLGLISEDVTHLAGILMPTTSLFAFRERWLRSMPAASPQARAHLPPEAIGRRRRGGCFPAMRGRARRLSALSSVSRCSTLPSGLREGSRWGSPSLCPS